MNSVFPHASLNIKKKKIGKPLWKRIFSAENIKLGILASVVLGFFLGYIITITISSTKGYYYDQSLKEQSQADFQYNIAKLQNLKLESNLRNSIDLKSAQGHGAVEHITISR